MTLYKTPKPKICPCGARFTPRGIQKYHDKACELKFKTGNVEPENIINLRLPVLYSMATGTFQAWIKNRDKNKGCYTCDKMKASMYHGGHAFKKEVFRGMIFNEASCKKQCDGCNIGLAGNEEEFFGRLLKELGFDVFNLLCAEADYTKDKNWSRIELVEIIKKYKTE